MPGDPSTAAPSPERPEWRIVVVPQAEKDLKRLPPSMQSRVRTAVDALIPWPGRGDFRNLQGLDEWRLLVGDWRVRFAPDFAARAIVVLRVLPRGSAYRD